MKKVLLSILFSLALGGLSAVAQSSSFDERLLVQFSESQINEMTAEELAFNTYCIDHSFEIMPFPTEKGQAVLDGSLNINNLQEINFFDLGLTLKEDQYQYYMINGTDDMIVIKPIFLIKKEL